MATEAAEMPPSEELPSEPSPVEPPVSSNEPNSDTDTLTELENVRQEKATLESQYKALLGKLTTMRNTLGDKLRQDADELDRREQQIALLQNQLDDLNGTVETLREELIAAHEDCDTAHAEAEKLRTRALDSQRSHANEYTEREEALQHTRQDLEDSKLMCEELRREVMTQASLKEEAEDAAAEAKMRVGEIEQIVASLKQDLAQESESVSNLQSVLEEFQLGKEAEIQRTVSDVETQLHDLQHTAATFKERAEEAEKELRSLKADRDLLEHLKRELNEKNAIIGKLRHEGVILNEHLTEAVRKLKRDSAEYSVDGRLITNVLLAFITTPRGDSKRFEMLSILASVLSWTDDQREQVGLQRTVTGTSGTPSRHQLHSHGSRNGKGHTRTPGQGRSQDALGENDTFSSLFIEFLLKESLRHDSSTSRTGGLENGSNHVVDPPLSPGSTLSRRSDTTLQ